MLNMMFADCIYLSVLTWYFEQVWPSEFGTQKPWYFVFEPKYWIKVFSVGSNKSIYRRVHLDEGTTGIEMTPVEAGENVSNGPESVYIEPVAVNLRAQVESRTCVDIKNLYKVFNTTSGIKVAVNKLNLTLYSGQITALLGYRIFTIFFDCDDYLLKYFN
jgi:ATP-binding cassette, subfamily A (ABC1), member 3